MSHTHDIIDKQYMFSITPSDRAIRRTSHGKMILMQGDHNSVTFVFRMPRYIGSQDMSLCNKIELNYINITSDKKNKTEDVYMVKDMAVDTADDGYIVFSWKLTKNATKYAGVLSFLIDFRCIKEDTTVDYSWHTNKCILPMTEGMDNAEAVIEAVSDVLAAWEAKVVEECIKRFDENFKALENKIADTYETKENANETKNKLNGHLENLAWYAKKYDLPLQVFADVKCDTDLGGVYVEEVEATSDIPIGRNVRVMYNGVEYIRIVKMAQLIKDGEILAQFTIVGNASLLLHLPDAEGATIRTDGNKNTGEPFVIASLYGVFALIALEESTISMFLLSYEILPEMYLPKDIVDLPRDVKNLTSKVEVLTSTIEDYLIPTVEDLTARVKALGG